MTHGSNLISIVVNKSYYYKYIWYIGHGAWQRLTRRHTMLPDPCPRPVVQVVQSVPCGRTVRPVVVQSPVVVSIPTVDMACVNTGRHLGLLVVLSTPRDGYYSL